MEFKLKKVITIIMFLFSLQLLALPVVDTEIKSVQTVLEQVEELNQRFSSKDILIVFDIDNTVLRTSSVVPSDQWFEWQWDEISKKSEFSITNDHGEFLSHLEELYWKAEFLLTETPLTKKAVNQFKSQNQFFYLTSRNSGMIEVTDQALHKNGIGFATNSLKAMKLSKGTAFNQIAPKYMLDSYSKSRQKTNIQYHSNVFFTAGLNKGMMLRLMLMDAGINPKAIIFMDDKAKHTANVQKEFSEDTIEVYTYTYHQVLDQVHEFEALSAQEKNAKYWEFMSASE
jgi:hypothetical protein